jgi:hypothetical protein
MLLNIDLTIKYTSSIIIIPKLSLENHMKRALVVLLLLTASSTALADRGYRGGHHHGHHHNRGYNNNNNWVVPAIIGSAVVGGLIYGAARPPTYTVPPVQYYAPPIQQYNTSPPVYVDPTPQIPYGYRVEQILDASCNCYRTVLVPN